MSDTIHETVHVITSLPQPGEPTVNPAVPLLIERLKQQSERYTRACQDGERGYSNFLFIRMEITSRRILELARTTPRVDQPGRH